MKPSGKLNRPEGLPPTPPPGTGNKTLTEFSKEYSLDIRQRLKGLNDNDVSASADMPIKQIARQNNMAPTDIYTYIFRITSPSNFCSLESGVCPL